MLWNLVLDMENGVTIQPQKHNCDKNEKVIRQLTIQELQKIGSYYDDLNNSAENEKQMVKKLKCQKCKLWLPGLCYKHPLVFIKEKVPISRFYHVGETFPPFLFLAPSTIPRAGKGVFTRAVLPTGLCFGPYAGFASSDMAASKTSGYSWRITKPGDVVVWVDAKNELGSNWMRYANCPRFEEEQNMVAYSFHSQMYYYTYKNVAAGSELMVWYGSKYGEMLGIPHAKYGLTSLAPKKLPNVNYDRLHTAGSSTSGTSTTASSGNSATSTGNRKAASSSK
uniref:SET domain-containing protein n=1 Tax=Romanomermis culicivorax TaxID=13658 RepID=A0A915KC49_ROMCU